MLQGFRTARGAKAERTGGRYAPPGVSESGLVSDMIGAVSRAMSDDSEAQLRARQVDAVLRLQLPLMAVHVVNVAALLFVLWFTGQSSVIEVVWAVALLGLALKGAWSGWRRRHRAPPRTTSVRTVRRVVASALVFGLAWAVPGLAFVPDLSGFAAVFAYLLLTGMIAGGAFGLYPIPAAAYAFIGPVVVSGLAGIAMVHGVLAAGPAALTAMFLIVFRGVLRRHADLFVSEFLGRLELEKRNRLIEDLLEDARVEALGTRQMIEQRLARAEKMEAIGHLTGGIAHSFNNLLATIQGNAELLELDGRSDPAFVDPILAACRQGSDQVERLLSIAGKQRLHPEAVPLEPLLDGLRRILEPSLGPDYRVTTSLARGLRPVLADPAQLESALLGLCLNARDAMENGGEISIACRMTPLQGLRSRLGSAAASVEIRVRDTGCGMDAETRERALDPFFTTKGLWRSGGLGLSSVAGFVRQSQGELAIESAPGRGTSVTLRLPAAPARRGDGETAPEAALPGSPEILLVEDFADVRRMTEQVLASLGCTVMTASDAGEAMEIVRGPARIDAVLTDILLSGPATGVQLARQIRDVRPDLPVTFMSGWSSVEGMAPGGRVLRKPFSRAQLEAHLRRALSAETG